MQNARIVEYVGIHQQYIAPLSHCIFDGVHRQHTAHVEPGVNRDMGPRRPLETRELLILRLLQTQSATRGEYDGAHSVGLDEKGRLGENRPKVTVP